MKTDIEIKDDIYTYLKGSALMSAISGAVYKSSRPSNSKKEDALITILANQYGQNQKAYVNVNIFVKDKTMKHTSDGVVTATPIEDSARLRTLSEAAFAVLERYVGIDFCFELEEQRIYEGNGEHFINNKLLYKTNNE